MRTGLFLLAGFLLLAESPPPPTVSQNYPASTTWATAAFLLLWLLLGVQPMGRRDEGRLLDPRGAADPALSLRSAGCGLGD